MFRINLGVCGLVLITGLILAPLSGARAEDWPRFRGPAGNGHSSETDLPIEWNPGQLTYRVELPGTGQSSPIVFGDQIFLTTSTNKGRTRVLLCLDRDTGKVSWSKSFSSSKQEKLHQMNTWSTPSCATDGERVVAFFGPGGIHCYSTDGKKKLWSKQLGTFPGGWGVAASPVIIGDMVIQNCDSQGDGAYMIAFDKNSGKQIWKTKRKDLPKGGWSTPIIIDAGSRKELVINGEWGVQGYDPATGRDLWFCKSFNGRGTPMPAYSGNFQASLVAPPEEAPWHLAHYIQSLAGLHPVE